MKSTTNSIYQAILAKKLLQKKHSLELKNKAMKLAKETKEGKTSLLTSSIIKADIKLKAKKAAPSAPSQDRGEHLEKGQGAHISKEEHSQKLENPKPAVKQAKALVATKPEN